MNHDLDFALIQRRKKRYTWKSCRLPLDQVSFVGVQVVIRSIWKIFPHRILWNTPQQSLLPRNWLGILAEAWYFYHALKILPHFHQVIIEKNIVWLNNINYCSWQFKHIECQWIDFFLTSWFFKIFFNEWKRLGAIFGKIYNFHGGSKVVGFSYPGRFPIETIFHGEFQLALWWLANWF